MEKLLNRHINLNNIQERFKNDKLIELYEGKTNYQILTKSQMEDSDLGNIEGKVDIENNLKDFEVKYGKLRGTLKDFLNDIESSSKDDILKYIKDWNEVLEDSKDNIHTYLKSSSKVTNAEFVTLLKYTLYINIVASTLTSFFTIIQQNGQENGEKVLLYKTIKDMLVEEIIETNDKKLSDDFKVKYMEINETIITELDGQNRLSEKQKAMYRETIKKEYEENELEGRNWGKLDFYEVEDNVIREWNKIIEKSEEESKLFGLGDGEHLYREDTTIEFLNSYNNLIQEVKVAKKIINEYENLINKNNRDFEDYLEEEKDIIDENSSEKLIEKFGDVVNLVSSGGDYDEDFVEKELEQIQYSKNYMEDNLKELKIKLKELEEQIGDFKEDQINILEEITNLLGDSKRETEKEVKNETKKEVKKPEVKKDIKKGREGRYKIHKGKVDVNIIDVEFVEKLGRLDAIEYITDTLEEIGIKHRIVNKEGKGLDIVIDSLKLGIKLLKDEKDGKDFQKIQDVFSGSQYYENNPVLIALKELNGTNLKMAQELNIEVITLEEINKAYSRGENGNNSKLLTEVANMNK